MDYNAVDTFPKFVTDIAGNRVDVERLAQRHHVILITLKATWCQVCPPLLKTINLYGLGENNSQPILDPFNNVDVGPDKEEIELFRLLLRKDAYFIILSPGPVNEVREIQLDTCFEDFPFVVDEDLSLAGSIRLRLSSTQIWPAIMHIEPSMRLRPVHFGRAPGFYGISVLLSYLKNQREKIENQCLDVLQEAQLVMNWISKRLTSIPPPSTPDTLPLEILVDTFRFLSPEHLAVASQTCRTFHYLSLISISDRIRYWIKEIHRSCPRSQSGTIVCHSQLNQLGPYSDPTFANQVLRRPYPISQLRDATNHLRMIITSFMMLGDKTLIPQ